MNALIIVAALFLQAGDPATHRITFTSGRFLDCRVEDEGDRDLYVRVDSARMRISRDNVRRVERIDLAPKTELVVAEVVVPDPVPEVVGRVDDMLARLSGDELRIAVGQLAPDEARHLIRRLDSLALEMRTAALAGLATVDVDVRKLLASPHADVRRAAALILGSRPGTFDISEVALDRDGTVRSAAVASALTIASKNGTESALAASWLRILPRGTDGARADVVAGLGRLAARNSTAEIRAAIEPLLKDRSAAVRGAAADALAESKGSIDALVTALAGETETSVAVRICEALGRSGLTAAIHPLREAQRSHQDAIRKAADQALTQLTRKISR